MLFTVFNSFSSLFLLVLLMCLFVVEWIEQVGVERGLLSHGRRNGYRQTRQTDRPFQRHEKQARSPFPHLDQGRRHRHQPGRRQSVCPVRCLVESGQRRTGVPSRLSNGPDQVSLRISLSRSSNAHFKYIYLV